jgi:hypothetical protein
MRARTRPVVARTAGASTRVRHLLRRAVEEPTALARDGGPLAGARLDHVTLALESESALRREFAGLVEGGATVREPVAAWPEDVGGRPAVEPRDRKWIATVDVGPWLVVLVAPRTRGDVVARFLRAAGGAGVHHVAYAVPDVRAATAACLREAGTRRIARATGRRLSQVFLRVEGEIAIVELVRRHPRFRGTFTPENVAALTAGERGG